MDTQNQQRYQEFQQTVNTMKNRQAELVRDIDVVKEQIKNMELELSNLEQSILMHNGGLETIRILTENGIALVVYSGEVPLSINQHAVAQQAAHQATVPQQQSQQIPQAPPQQQANYPQQPTQQTYTPQPAITQQAQQQFAPADPMSLPGNTPTIQGPQMMQGTLSEQAE